MLVGALLAFGILAAAEPVAASAPATAAVPEAAKPVPKPAEKRVRAICRDDAPTGTRFSKRTCVRVEDFKAREDKAYDGMLEMQHNANSSNPST